MLINISNHSYALWKPKQLITALEKFDKVEDFFMPEVNPAFTADQVREMASKIIADDSSGNATFSGTVTANDFNSFRASLPANTVLNSDGTKTIQFEFEQFRQIIK